MLLTYEKLSVWSFVAAHTDSWSLSWSNSGGVWAKRTDPHCLICPNILPGLHPLLRHVIMACRHENWRCEWKATSAGLNLRQFRYRRNAPLGVWSSVCAEAALGQISGAKASRGPLLLAGWKPSQSWVCLQHRHTHPEGGDKNIFSASWLRSYFAQQS